MRKFLKKRWHTIPVGIISAMLMAVLLVGSVFAAYTFLTLTVEIEVEEPMIVSMNDYSRGEGWLVIDGDTPFEDWGVAGDSETFGLRVENRANNPITITTTITGYDKQYFTLTGLPTGEIAAETTWQGDVIATIDADAPPSGDDPYTFNIVFDRS